MAERSPVIFASAKCAKIVTGGSPDTIQSESSPGKPARRGFNDWPCREGCAESLEGSASRSTPWHEDRMYQLCVPERVTCRERATTMQSAIASNQVGNFPVIQFRKKRLTVAIHTHFDMQNAEDVNEVKRLVEQALAQLSEDGDVKVSYALSDV